jgi:hypothetical protein
MDCEGVAASA